MNKIWKRLDIRDDNPLILQLIIRSSGKLIISDISGDRHAVQKLPGPCTQVLCKSLVSKSYKNQYRLIKILSMYNIVPLVN